MYSLRRAANNYMKVPPFRWVASPPIDTASTKKLVFSATKEVIADENTKLQNMELCFLALPRKDVSLKQDFRFVARGAMLDGCENQQTTVESLVPPKYLSLMGFLHCLESLVSREISQSDGVLVVLGFVLLRNYYISLAAWNSHSSFLIRVWGPWPRCDLKIWNDDGFLPRFILPGTRFPSGKCLREWRKNESQTSNV